MSQMTLKQRRRHRELEDAFRRLKDNPYLQIPEDYEFGINVEEDKKYQQVIEEFQAVVAEMHEIEEIARTGY